MRRGKILAGALACAFVAAACTAASSSGAQTAGVATTTVPAPAGEPAAFAAHGSVGQVWLTGARHNTVASLFNAHGLVATATTDGRGSLIFRNLTPGNGYVVQVGSGAGAKVTNAVRVLRVDENPPASFYNSQQLVDGYQYLTTRDGTQLAIMVRLPGPADQGPYPTLIEYSGYSPADPNSPQPSTQLASVLGYATVGINIRGTGCSGGAFQFFEPLQGTDGYDAVEAIAAQPWVLHHKVGMVGISYPGISQLFVAETQPPHLAAIAPLSVIDDTYRGTLYPGGILNNGFAIGWAAERQSDARPAPEGGQGWATTRINAGDTTCLKNQDMHTQAPNVLKLAHEARWYERTTPIVQNSWQAVTTMDSLAPASFVNRIKVPVFLAGAWQDEQTGGHFANMLANFKRSPLVRFTMINGNHTEALTPEILVRWYEFLEFYVSERTPVFPAALRAALPVYFAGVFGPVQQLPPDRFTSYPSYAAARQAYEAELPVRILFENGAGCPQVANGAPCPTFEKSFKSWPPPASATPWYLGEKGRLTSSAPARAGSDSYLYSGDGQATTFSGSTSDIWLGLPPLTWNSPSAGHAASYVSSPLASTTVMAGTGRVDLFLGANVPDVDVQVTLSEVRADGTEYYVQAGWLRASHRKLDQSVSNDLRAVPTHRQSDARSLVAGKLVPVSVELFPFAHIFHAGSRVRLIIDVPGGTRPFWKFGVLQYPNRNVVVRLGRGGAMPARIMLPVVTGLGAEAPSAIPPCPSLRGEPCRTYQPYSNTH